MATVRRRVITVLDSRNRKDKTEKTAVSDNTFDLMVEAMSFLDRVRIIQGSNVRYDTWIVREHYKGMTLPKIILSGRFDTDEIKRHDGKA